MKRFISALIVIILSATAVSCNDNTSGKKETNTVISENTTIVTDADNNTNINTDIDFVSGKEYVDEFLSVQYSSDGGSAKIPKKDKETCFNVTSEGIYEEIGVRIFKFNDSCESYILIDGKIYPICESFGGYGFHNAITWDYNDDGTKDLLVASSWGSGMHRSEISIFDMVTKESTVLYIQFADLAVKMLPASYFTGNETDTEMYPSVILTRYLNIVNDNYSSDDFPRENKVLGYIEVKDSIPTFVEFDDTSIYQVRSY